jgi:hypothetical protein
MADRNGAVLRPGDPVLWFGSDGPEEVVPAIVLRELGPGRYLIEMDPHGTTSRAETADVHGDSLEYDGDFPFEEETDIR